MPHKYLSCFVSNQSFATIVKLVLKDDVMCTKNK